MCPRGQGHDPRRRVARRRADPPPGSAVNTTVAVPSATLASDAAKFTLIQPVWRARGRTAGREQRVPGRQEGRGLAVEVRVPPAENRSA